MFGKKRDLGKIAGDRRADYWAEGKDMRVREIEYLKNLKERFESGKIDEADVAEAFRIIQTEANLISLKPGNDHFRVIDLLARCGMEIMNKGKVSLSEGNLIYVRQKMPVETFIDANIKRLEESKDQADAAGMEAGD